MRPLTPLTVAALLVALPAGPVALAPSTAVAGDDAPKQFTLTDPRITESSGLAASRLHPGIYWTHNDSGHGPYLYAVDSRTGRTVATITMKGVDTTRDMEAISIGPGNTLYVGDIGDNVNSWPHVWIYELPEPHHLRDQTIRATQYTVRYTNGSRDAEALLVHPKTGRVYIVDKNEDGGHLYEGPATLSPSGTNVFRPVAPIDLWVTDGAFSPDGRQFAVRGYFGGILYDWQDGRPKRRAMLQVPMQNQGEGITFTPDGSALMYSSEGARSPVVPGSLPGSSSSGGGGGSSAGNGANGGSAGASGGAGKRADYGKGALVLLIALAVVFGAKRVIRRD